MAYPKTQTYTLPEGIELSFTDGGPPPNSSDYTTVFAIHGVTFNAYQFRKLHQHSHAFNLRTVALHRRDYIGSTSLTTSELEEMNRGDRSYWDRLSAQVAQLLKLFIERENIPKLTVTGNRRSGGIAIMGWSFGCATVLSLLGSARNPRIPRELYKLLEKYIGDFVLYDPPAVAFGYPLPADCKNYNPWLDSSLSPAEVPMAFARWVSSYYDHPCYDSATRSLPASATIHDLDGARRYANKEEEVSIASWTETELTKGIELEPGANDVILFAPTPQETISINTKEALFDHKSAHSWFPNAKISYIGCTRTNWPCAWGEIETKKRYYGSANGASNILSALRTRLPSNLTTLICGSTESESKNLHSDTISKRKGRQIQFISMDGANHFAHLDRTAEFLQVLTNAVRTSKHSKAAHSKPDASLLPIDARRHSYK